MSQYTDLWKVALSRVGEREPRRKRGKSELVVNSQRGQRSRQRTKPRDRSLDVLEFIRTFTAENAGIPPSVQEIVDGCGLSSKSHAHYYLTRLRDQGRVTWEPRSIRTVRVTE